MKKHFCDGRFLGCRLPLVPERSYLFSRKWDSVSCLRCLSLKPGMKKGSKK